MVLLYGLSALLMLMGSDAAGGTPGVQSSTVHGTVKDAQGAVVWHASIQIEDKASASARQEAKIIETDSSGRFSAKIPAGQYQICASRSAFSTGCKTVNIEEGKEINVDFALHLDPAYASKYAPKNSEVMDQRLLTLSGSNAIDCGHVAVHGNRQVATGCVRQAGKRNQPFHVRYDVAGIDSEIAGGLAGDGAGNMYAVTFDSLGMTSEGLIEGENMADGSHTVVAVCPKPVKITVNKSGKPTCFKRSRKPAWILDQ